MVTELIGLAEFIEHFHEATGLPVTVAPGELSPVTLLAWGRRHPFCRAVVAMPVGKKLYLDSIAGLCAPPATAKTVFVTCASGLTHAAVPVRIGEQRVGTVLVGQVFLSQPRASDFERLTGNLRRAGIQEDFTKYRHAYFQTPAYPAKRFRKCVDLVEAFVARRWPAPASQPESEPDCVRRAKEVIQARLSGPLPLPELAQHAGLCREHFSRQFKKSTGLTVTDYIARARIERAKQLLADRHKRIAEVAYESGFNSISAFNRTFGKLIGQTPTAYRRTLL